MQATEIEEEEEEEEEVYVYVTSPQCSTLLHFQLHLITYILLPIIKIPPLIFVRLLWS
jgi:predicted transcriptional regulator